MTDLTRRSFNQAVGSLALLAGPAAWACTPATGGNAAESPSASPASPSPVEAPAAPPPPVATARVPLGRTGLSVPRLAMGTGSNGWARESDQTRLGEREFVKLMRHGVERGAQFIDA